MTEISVLELQKIGIGVKSVNKSGASIILRTTSGNEYILKENYPELRKLAAQNPLPKLIVSLLPEE